MKKETGIVIAASVGFLAVLGILKIKSFLNRKEKEYHDYYNDFHRHFEKKSEKDHYHGVEYL